MKTQLSAFFISAMIFGTDLLPIATEKTADTGNNVQTGNVVSAVFTSFSTHRQGKGITLNWGVQLNAGVINFTIQKTYEDITDPYALWEDVTTLPEDGSKSYKYTDDNVFPGNISYRIVAHFIDGTTEVSGISTVNIVSR